MRRIMSVVAFALVCLASQPAWADDSSICAGSNDDLAIPACGKIIGKKSTSRASKAQALYNRAISYSHKGLVDLALKDYDQAIALKPDYASAYINRGSIYRDREQLDLALPDFNKAIDLKPDSDTAFNNRGNVYSDREQLDSALADYSKAISLKPTNELAFNNRCIINRKLEKFDEALADCSKAIELEPGYANAYYNRGNVYRKQKETDKAVADFTKAISLDSSDADYFFYRALTYQNNDDLDPAIADYGKALELTPTDFTTLLNRGLAYKKKGELDLAIADYDKALEVKPDASAFNSRGNAYFSKGDLDRAIKDYDSAIAQDANYADGYYNRGTTFTDKGDFDRAITDLDKAIELRPDDSTSFNARANAHRKKGETDKAIADYRRALALQPDYEDAKKGLSDTLQALPPIQTDTAKAAEEADSSKSTEPAVEAQPAIRRVALVIGNSSYRSVAHLPNPAGDAQLVGDALRAAGIDDVTIAQDLDRSGMIATLKAFTRKADNSDWAMIYYAGHGMELDGKNYLIPVDASLETDRDVPDETLSLDRVLSAVSGARQLKLVILDACRNNPFAQQMKVTVATRAVQRGLSRVEPLNATLVVYSAKEGTTAEDGDGTNSVFAKSISKRLVEPGVEINKVFRLVTKDVMSETGSRQQPFVYGSLPPDDFILVPTK
jgi:tetratricopeptide (TPR) repeat protein